jgi:DNA polymerase III epsilon subunit-like protein
MPLFANRCIDTLTLARRIASGVKDYKLDTLAAHFGIVYETRHRALADCHITFQLYEKLINLLNTN